MCCFLSYAFITLFDSGYVTGESKKNLLRGNSSQTVAVIDIDEVISSVPVTDIWGNEILDMTTVTLDKLDIALNDDRVKAVLLRLNTPGGEVYATREIYNKLQEIKAADKKVIVLMEDVAASGGYYISAAADYIVASEMTLTGSIGVVFSSLDLTGLYDKVGIKEIAVANSEGRLKVLNDLSNENGEGYKLLQSLADDYYDNFIRVVAEGRGMTVEEAKELGDGRVYSGRQAFDNGLVDELGEWNEAVEAIKKIAGLDDPNFVLLDEQPNAFGNFSLSLKNILSPFANYTDQLASGDKIKASYILRYY